VIGRRHGGALRDDRYGLFLDLTGEYTNENSTSCINKILVLFYLCVIL
jgi:hypothetical protein